MSGSCAQMEKQQFYKMVPYDASASVPMVIYDARPGRQVKDSNTTREGGLFSF